MCDLTYRVRMNVRRIYVFDAVKAEEMKKLYLYLCLCAKVVLTRVR